MAIELEVMGPSGKVTANASGYSAADSQGLNRGAAAIKAMWGDSGKAANS
jgi:hypothetical protein